MLDAGLEIGFAHRPFKWNNLAKANAGVTCVIVGVRALSTSQKVIIDDLHRVVAKNISPYLIDMENVIVLAKSKPSEQILGMKFGNMPYDNGNLILSDTEKNELVLSDPTSKQFIRKLLGAEEIIHGKLRWCLWIDDDQLDLAITVPEIRSRVNNVKNERLKSSDLAGQKLAARPHQFRERHISKNRSIVVPAVSSESRAVLPCELVSSSAIITNRCFQIMDSSLVEFSIIVSRLHYVWADTVGGKLESRFNYSSTLVYNTFPLKFMQEQDKADLVRCAEEILLAREAHFPKTIADLYDPEAMPDDLRAAHERNDEVLERIYIGRCFKNDTERLEKLFELYTKTTANQPQTKGAAKKKKATA